MAKQFYKRQSKYHNEPVTVDGVKFDSKNEHRRWCFLKMMEKAGEISDLQYHVPFTLIPKGSVEILKMPDGTEIVTREYDRKHWYEADFVYATKNGEVVVEDFKGFETETFKRKRELFKLIYKKDIKVVKQINELTF